MDGAIFYTSKYGSTRDYANWIAEATGLEAFDIKGNIPELETFDFLVLGSPVFYGKLRIAKWMRSHSEAISSKPTLLFTVSGTAEGAKLDGTTPTGLPQQMIEHIHHVGLRGRQSPKQLRWFDRMVLNLMARATPDKQAAREAKQGFDHVDKTSIQPAVELITTWQATDDAASPAATSANLKA